MLADALDLGAGGCHARTGRPWGREAPAQAPTQRQQPSSHVRHMKSPRPRSVTRLDGAVWARTAGHVGHAGRAGCAGHRSHADARDGWVDGPRQRDPDLRTQPHGTRSSVGLLPRSPPRTPELTGGPALLGSCIAASRHGCTLRETRINAYPPPCHPCPPCPPCCAFSPTSKCNKRAEAPSGSPPQQVTDPWPRMPSPGAGWAGRVCPRRARQGTDSERALMTDVQDVRARLVCGTSAIPDYCTASAWRSSAPARQRAARRLTPRASRTTCAAEQAAAQHGKTRQRAASRDPKPAARFARSRSALRLRLRLQLKPHMHEAGLAGLAGKRTQAQASRPDRWGPGYRAAGADASSPDAQRAT